jgi:hypothetical protein
MAVPTATFDTSDYDVVGDESGCGRHLDAFTSQATNSSATTLGAASGLAYAADTLFVADANRVGATPSNHRVLLFKNLSSQLPVPDAELSSTSGCGVWLGASFRSGQPDFTTTTENVPAKPSALRLPTAVASDGVHLVVADTNHNRVLIWNSIPTVNSQPADVVVGQLSRTTSVICYFPVRCSLTSRVKVSPDFTTTAVGSEGAAEM